jgi:hypothetical protein
MPKANIFPTNSYLLCVVDDDNKTVTCTILDEGTVERNCDRFHKLIACLGSQYFGYTVIGIITMPNNKIATITTIIM